MIKKEIFSLLNFKYGNEINVIKSKNVYAELNNGNAYVGGPDKSSIARAYSLFAYEYGKIGKDFKIEQNAVFKNRGVMLDVSRNGVIRVDKLKKYIAYLAAHGLNILLLYMEDTYQVPGYEHFGYMRGRYSIDELKEIDDYGFEMGVEVIPCVQFLGHMRQYLRWQETNEFKDTDDILMIGEEKTYKFIEAAVGSLRKSLRTDKIHIGMDEAHNVGLGNYLAKNGFKNRFNLMNEHLSKVLEICKKNNFKPMMWSDMFFRLGSATGDYYDDGWVAPKDIIADIPDVDMVYWDYYHEKKDDFLSMIKKHRLLQKNIIFAGGVWMWDGFLPNNAYTLKSMVPAMEACIDEGIETIFLTAWEDDGCETNHFMSLPGLSVLSEYCFRGKAVREEDIREFSAFITKMDYDAVDAMSDFHNGEIGDVKPGKRYIWSDFLYNLTDYKTDYEKMEKRFFEAYKVLENKDGKHRKLYKYAALLLKLAYKKSLFLRTLREEYIKNNRGYLEEACRKILPEFKADYIKLHKLHKEQWLDMYKPFGWEVLDGRYAAMEARAAYAAERISDYLDGKINIIEELEEKPLFQEKPIWGDFANMTCTSLVR